MKWDDENFFSDIERYSTMTAVMTQSVHTQTDVQYSNDYMFHRDSRTYLECPYHERLQVKELGARWDNIQRRWYAPPGTNLEPLRKWIKERIYLRCNGVEDRSTIESLGARYDTTLSGYYIFDDTDQEPFARWLP